MLDLRGLVTFREVLHARSFSGAARSLGYTQPAISQQIRQLERAMGAPLFVRSGRTLLLTEAGKALEEHCTEILGQVAIAERHVASIADLSEGSVRLCSFPSAFASLVPDAIARLTAKYPRIRVELQESEPPDSLQKLRAGDCDVVISFTYDSIHPPDDGALLTIRLLEDPLVIILPAGNAAARLSSIDLERFSDARWIVGCPDCSQCFTQACVAAGFDPDIVCSTDDNLSMQRLVLAGMGYACVPELAVSAIRLDGLASVPIKGPILRKIVAHTWADLARTRSISETLSMLKAGARSVRAQLPSTGGSS